MNTKNINPNSEGRPKDVLENGEGHPKDTPEDLINLNLPSGPSASEAELEESRQVIATFTKWDKRSIVWNYPRRVLPEELEEGKTFYSLNLVPQPSITACARE